MMYLEELHTTIGTQEKNICQVCACKEGREVYHDTWNGFQKNDACHVASVTKSVVSLLVGIAIDQGMIQGTDQYVLDFFPEYSIKRGEKTIQHVTIGHLLGCF